MKATLVIDAIPVASMHFPADYMRPDTRTDIRLEPHPDAVRAGLFNAHTVIFVTLAPDA